MSNGKLSPAGLAAVADLIWPDATSLGYLILLRGDLFTGTFTVDASSDELTCSGPHGMVTGSRFRVTTDGILPSPAVALLTTTDYYAIRISSTVLQLALSLADANSGIAVNFLDAGTGTHTLTEQRLTELDPIAVLIAKEVDHGEYYRREVTSIGTANPVGLQGEKNPISQNYSVGSGSYSFRHVLFLRGATSTTGDTTGTIAQMTTESDDVTVEPGSGKIVTVLLYAANVI